jgi:hypothetical protein
VEFAKELKNEHGNTIEWTAKENDNTTVCSEKCKLALKVHTIDLDQWVFDGYNEGGITGWADSQYGYSNWYGLCLPWHYPHGHSQARYHQKSAGWLWYHMTMAAHRWGEFAHGQLEGFKPVVYHKIFVHKLPDAMRGVGQVMLSKLRAYLSMNLDFSEKLDREHLLRRRNCGKNGQIWGDRLGLTHRSQQFFEGQSTCYSSPYDTKCTKPKAYYMEVLLFGNPYLDRWGGRENPDYPDYTSPNRRNVQADIFHLVETIGTTQAVDFNRRYNL